MTPNASWDQCKALAEKHQFTSWPWGIEFGSETLWVGPLRPDGMKVEQVVVALNYDRDLTHAAKVRQLANAHLISAAPELLAIAEHLLDRGYVSKHCHDEHDDYMQLVAAIAKARGQS